MSELEGFFDDCNLFRLLLLYIIYELLCVVIGVVVDIYKKVDLWTFWKDSFHSLVLEVCLFVEFCWIFHDG